LHRRQFLNAATAASALALAGQAQAQSSTPAAGSAKREYYQLRTYYLQSGPQNKLCQDYFANALIPALNRRGMTPVGAFRLDIGPETPTNYLLIPSSSLEELALLDQHLSTDDTFLKAADPFWNAPATAPSFKRIETRLLAAFDAWPKLVTPPHIKRIFQLRTYESPTHQDHVHRLEMFNKVTFDAFQRSGCGQVLYADTLVGTPMPSLTYMLTFPDLTAMTAGWAAFRVDAELKKQTDRFDQMPKYSSQAVISNINNLILSPLACSQI
jgi:hypothetical protein